MLMKQNKIITFLNFAKKAGNIVYGMDNLKEIRKKLFCVVVDYTASENLISKVTSFCKIKNIALINVQFSLDEAMHTKNCKVLGVCNEMLGKQIIQLNKIEE